MTEAKVKCEICGKEAHTLEAHIAEEHQMTLSEYKAKHSKTVLSNYALQVLNQRFKATKLGLPVKVDFNIQKAFGISNFPKEKIQGYNRPHESTPAIDTNYVFDKNLLSLVMFAIENQNERVLMTGHTGSGKSSVIEQVVARLNLPFCRVNCDGDLTRADFVGQTVLENQGTKFQYGLLPMAMKEGRVLLIDEWDAASPSVSLALQSVLEEGGKLTITETQEVIHPHPDFRIFATSNTKGQGDDSGMYHGTQPQNYAALDRFTMVGLVDYPTATVEMQIITAKTGIKAEHKDSVLERLVQFATLVRKAFIKEEITCTMSTRTVVNVARKLIAFGDIKQAYSIAFMNKLNSEDLEFCQEIYSKVW